MGKRRNRRNNNDDDEDNGFAQWGGYMNAKKAKLVEQFHGENSTSSRLSNIFNGIAIMVNGWTRPCADDLKQIMADHGGTFHMYQMGGSRGATTHIIASNLPNVKIKKLGNTPIVKPEWITKSIEAGKLLDYKKFVLYTNQSRTQPRLDFIVKPSTKDNTNSTLNKKLEDIIELKAAILESELPSTSNTSKGDKNVCVLSPKIGETSKKRKKPLTSHVKKKIVPNCSTSPEKENVTDKAQQNVDLFHDLLSEKYILESKNSEIESKNNTNLTINEDTTESPQSNGNVSRDIFEESLLFSPKSSTDLFVDGVSLEKANNNNVNDQTINTPQDKSVKSNSTINDFDIDENIFNDSLTFSTSQINKTPSCDENYINNNSTNLNSDIEKVHESFDHGNKQYNQSNAETKKNIDDGKSNETKILNNEPPSVEKIHSNKNGESIIEMAKKSPTKTASDPKFLSEFYNNSRLHLISTLGAEFKQLVCTLRENSDGKFLGKETLLQSMKDTSIKNSGKIEGKIIMHIDMDCFFVSVGLRNRPDLRGKPVAVAHARGNTLKQNLDRQTEFALYAKRLPEGSKSRLLELDANSSMSELASCSYEARQCGIKNGMFLGQALKLCPNLQTIPYDFQGYREVSNILYETIASYTLDIEAVSCDEMYVDVTNILKETRMSIYQWASHIRGEIMSKTKCPCSTGFGANRLQSRLATRKAKPAGQFYLKPEDVEEYMFDLPLVDLPGVGHATIYKLKSLGLRTCGDVQGTSLAKLQAELGQKAGETIFEQSKGIDKKPLNFEHERKSVSAEVNYGIRFQTKDEALKFLESLSEEVFNRLKNIGMKAKSVTLKIMVRADEAPKETAKFLGHGICDSLSKGVTTNYLIAEANSIYREVKSLYEKLNVQPTDLRGIGIQLGRLEKNAVKNSVLSSFLKQNNKKKIDDHDKINKEKPSTITSNQMENHESSKVEDDRKIIEENNNLNKIKETKVLIEKSIEKREQTMNTSKRGRPKGSRNSRSLKNVKTSSNLTTYFKSGRFESSKVSSGLAGTIDFDVLNELPNDIREEILKNIETQNNLLNSFKKQESNINKAGPSKEKTPLKIETSKTPLQKKEKVAITEEPKATGFRSLSYENFKQMLRSWVLTDKPLSCDIQMLGEYFKEMALDRKIENLHSIIKFLHYLLEKSNNCFWHEVYFTIINFAQEGMLMTYETTLMVPRKFKCVLHS